MNLEIIHVGLLGTNCYVTWDDNKNCVVVDCGGDARRWRILSTSAALPRPICC